MGALTSPLCCAVKCCGCIILSQLIGLLLSIGMLVLFIAAFYFFILPWGERKIVRELGLPAGTDYDSISASTIAAHNCSGCVYGRNTEWPTTTTGTLHFLDTSAGTTISSAVATTLVASAAAGAGTMLWASIVPSMASALSFAGGFYEMTHILEQAQYIGMIGQLQLKGSPEFLTQFSKQLAWTNFNVPKSITEKFLPSRRLGLTDTVADTASAAVQPKYGGETGPAKYAKTLGVDAKDLFFYTLKIFAAVIVVIHVLYVIWVMIMSCVSKKLTFGEVAAKWYRKVIWAVILALLLGQYIFAMTGSYVIYENMHSSEPKDSHFALACVLLVAVVGFAIIFGIAVIANNTDELKDIGTVEHDDRPFAAKYSAYYDEYNFDNRFFFVPRILLAVATGVIVGIVQDPTKQLFCVLGVTFLYLLLIILREPNLLRFLYYIGLASVFMKVVLVCMMLVLVQDDFFPQNVRDKVAYAIIGVNIFIFFLLFLRQAYVIIYKIVRGCKNKGKNNDDDDDDDDARRQAIEEANRSGNGRYERLNSSGGAHGTRNGGYQNDPYSQSQQFKEQNFMAGQQQQPYGRSDVGIQGAAAGASVGYGANSRYDQQQQQQQYHPTSPSSGQSGGARGAGMNQSGYGASGYGMDPRQGGNYGSGADPRTGGQDPSGYGVNNANAGRPQGRSITDRYLGIEAGAAAVGAGVAVGAAANVRSSQQDNNQQYGPAGAVKPEPEKYTWRRNMERRAAEAAAAEEAARPQAPQRDSLMRFDSDDSYGTDRVGDNSRGMDSTFASSGYASDAVTQNALSPRQRQQQQSYGTEPSAEWFNQRASDMDSYASGSRFGGRSDLAGSSLDPGSTTGGDDVASSFMSADSYSSSRQGTMMDSQRSYNSGMDDSSRAGVARMDTQNLDNLAVAYLNDAGGGAAAAENDIGDEDESDDEGVAPLLDFPKAGDVDDKDETESVDIDAAPDSDEEDQEVKAGDEDVDVDVDVDEDEDVDIDDESDEDIDIDSITSHDKDKMASTILSDSSADRDSYSNIKQLDDIRDSYLSAGSEGYARQMSDLSLHSDDDASFYVEGRRAESPSADERQKEREKTSGPLKL